MPYYLVQAAFTKELIESLDEHPHNRLEAVRPVYEELGVTIHEGFLAFGEYDVVLLVEAPDNVHMAAIALAVTAGGAVVHYKTTPLLTWDEGVEAMRMAGGSSYTPQLETIYKRCRPVFLSAAMQPAADKGSSRKLA